MRILAIVLTGLLLAPVALAQTVAPSDSLRITDPEYGVDFGRALALDGDIAVVGIPGAEQGDREPGAIAIYERRADGWALVQRIVPSDFAEGRASEDAFFGASVALSGDLLAVGARGDDADDGTRQTGSVYVYERQPDGSWDEVAKLRDPNPAAFGEFGETVALDGDLLAVGAPSPRSGDEEGGGVYLFVRETDGTWSLIGTLRRPASEGRAFFGKTLAVSGSRVLVGAAADQGSAYLYERNITGIGWDEVAAFESPDQQFAGNSRQFGDALDLRGDAVLIGAYKQIYQYDTGFYFAGAAYLFERSADGSWPLAQRFLPDDLDRSELSSSKQIDFGFSVALGEDAVVIGARRDYIGDLFSAGSAYVFRHDDDGAWVRGEKLIADPVESSANYGFAVALDSDGDELTVLGTAISGREYGSVMVHTLPREVAPEPIQIVVRETVGVSDVPELTPPVLLQIREIVRASDAVVVTPALVLRVEEAIGVRDDPRVLAAIEMFVRERIAALDGVGLDLGDGTSLNARGVRVAEEFVAFFGPQGVEVLFDSVRTAGGLSLAVFAEAPEDRTGLPPGVPIAPQRWVLSPSDGLAFDSVRIAFDVDAVPGLADGMNVALYRRPTAGEGPFERIGAQLDADGERLVSERLAAFSEFVVAGEGVVVSTESEDGALVFGLAPPFPNPASSHAKVGVALAEGGPMRLALYDALGRRVAILAEGTQPPGRFVVDLRLGTLAAGTYLLRLESADQSATARLVVVR